MAALATFALARRHGLGFAGALTAMFAFIYSQPLGETMWAQMNLLATIAWLPVILLLLNYGIYAEGFSRKACYSLLAGIAFGMALLAGFPEHALYVAVFVVSYAVLCSLLSPPQSDARSSRPKFVLQAVGLVATAFAVAALIAAVMLLPAAELTHLSTRNTSPSSDAELPSWMQLVRRMSVGVALLVTAGLVSLFSFALQERLVPSANKKAEEVWNRINDVPARSYSFLDRRWVLSRNKNRIYHYSYFEPATGAFSQLSVFEIDPSSWSLVGRLYAEKGRLEGNLLNLSRGWSRRFPGESQARFEAFQEMDLRLAEDRGYFLKEVKEPALMSFGELKRYTAEVEGMGFETTRFKVDLSSKVSFPFVSLVMTLLAIPFAFSMGKRGALVGLGLSIVIAMLYWGALGVFRSLGYVSFLSPFLASWGPNLIFGPLGLYLLFRQRT